MRWTTAEDKFIPTIFLHFPHYGHDEYVARPSKLSTKPNTCNALTSRAIQKNQKAYSALVMGPRVAAVTVLVELAKFPITKRESSGCRKVVSSFATFVGRSYSSAAKDGNDTFQESTRED